MSLSKFRPLIAVTCSALVLALPAETEACWLTSCFSRPAACPAPVTQQVNYVPQTCYRTVYSPVAVTSYRPITTTDPCTGCPVTSLSPVTTYVQRPVVVPYTTYRPVVTTVLLPTAPACPCSPCATGACGAAPATSYYAPTAVAAPAPSCGCGASTAMATGAASTAYYAPSSTGYGAATASYYAPATSGATGSNITYYPPGYTTTSPSSPITGSVTTGSPTTTYYNGIPSNVAPGPVYFNSSANGGAGANTGVPSLPNNPTNSGSTQVQKPTDANPPPEAPKQPPPIPDNKEPAKGSSTGILKYEPGGRTTSMPILRPWSYTAVNWPHASTVSTAKPATVETDADGWHSAR
jgi:hypothetical protein